MEQVDRQISAFRQALAESWAWLAENSLDILSGLIAAALLVFLLLAIRSFGAWLGREQGISTLRLVVSRVIRKTRSEEHTSELQSLMRTSYAVFCLKKKKI